MTYSSAYSIGRQSIISSLWVIRYHGSVYAIVHLTGFVPSYHFGSRVSVEIDWSADPRELTKAEFKESGPPFRVIWLRNGRSTHYSGREPNTMVLEYLKWKGKKEDTTEQESLVN